MDFNMTITLIGGFLTAALGANAFLFKQMVSGLTKVEIGLAVLVAEHKATKSDIDYIKSELEFTEKKLMKVDIRLAILEAGCPKTECKG